MRNPSPLATREALNQSWTVDFMYNALVCGRRFRMFNVVDDFNREALSIEIDLNLPAHRVSRVLGRVAANRGYPALIRMDNGPEFISLALAEWAEKHAVILDFYLFITLNDVRKITEKWLSEYNCERPHESLNNIRRRNIDNTIIWPAYLKMPGTKTDLFTRDAVQVAVFIVSLSSGFRFGVQ